MSYKRLVMLVLLASVTLASLAATATGDALRQSTDVGTGCRSAIYATRDMQARVTDETIADANASGLWDGPVVTELAPAGPFWEAEPQHQDYLERHPHGCTCHFVRPWWELPRRARSKSA